MMDGYHLLVVENVKKVVLTSLNLFSKSQGLNTNFIKVEFGLNDLFLLIVSKWRCLFIYLIVDDQKQQNIKGPSSSIINKADL